MVALEIDQDRAMGLVKSYKVDRVDKFSCRGDY